MHVHGDPAVGDAVADGRVARALANAAENAARHAHDMPVALAARRSGRAIEITVADDGGGFPDGFEVAPFRPGARPGRAGLGLASALRAVRAAGGTMRCTSRDGGGLVSFRIPDGRA